MREKGVPVYARVAKDLPQDLEALLEALDVQRICRGSERVLIKPNFCTHDLAPGVTTDLTLLQILVDLLRDRVEEVCLVETESEGKSFARLRKACTVDAPLLNLSEGESISLETPHGPLSLPRAVTEFPLVNVPVLKTHALTAVTLGMKNLFGLLQDRRKVRYHGRIEEILVALAGRLEPPINLLDGLAAMEGEGPVSGEVRELGWLLASRDVVALDLATCRLLGIDADRVAHLRRVRERYGTRFHLVGDLPSPPPSFSVPWPTPLDRAAALLQSYGPTHALLRHPWIHPTARRLKGFLSKRWRR
jgi:uncharacterized protein (DUF362 family)